MVFVPVLFQFVSLVSILVAYFYDFHKGIDKKKNCCKSI